MFLNYIDDDELTYIQPNILHNQKLTKYYWMRTTMLHKQYLTREKIPRQSRNNTAGYLKDVIPDQQ